MLGPTSTPLTLSTNPTRPRATPDTSFGTLVHTGLVDHAKCVLQTYGVSSAGAEELMEGQTPSNEADRLRAFTLQEAMQRENVQFTSVSNVWKTRHDVQKASIHNTR